MGPVRSKIGWNKKYLFLFLIENSLQLVFGGSSLLLDDLRQPFGQDQADV
jgi:hypothetical protein